MVSQLISETKGWNSLPTDYITSVFPLKTIFLKFHWSFDVFLSFKDKEVADNNANGVGF